MEDYDEIHIVGTSISVNNIEENNWLEGVVF